MLLIHYLVFFKKALAHSLKKVIELVCIEKKLLNTKNVSKGLNFLAIVNKVPIFPSILPSRCFVLKGNRIWRERSRERANSVLRVTSDSNGTFYCSMWKHLSLQDNHQEWRMEQYQLWYEYVICHAEKSPGRSSITWYELTSTYWLGFLSVNKRDEFKTQKSFNEPHQNIF